jgi:hypothetical protein
MAGLQGETVMVAGAARRIRVAPDQPFAAEGLAPRYWALCCSFPTTSSFVTEAPRSVDGGHTIYK